MAGREFNDLPEDMRQRIFSYLPMKQRMRSRRVSKQWSKQIIAGVTKIVFVNRIFHQLYSPLLNYFHFARHHRVEVRNVVQIESILQQCHSVNRKLQSVKFMYIRFERITAEQVQAIQDIGHLMDHIEALEFHNCELTAPGTFHTLVMHLRHLVRLDIELFLNLFDISETLQVLLNQNEQLTHLKIKDANNYYSGLQVPQSLTSFHLCVKPKYTTRNVWITLRNNSGHSLQSFKSERFDEEQEQFLAFPNLEDIRLGNIKHYLSEQVIPLKAKFPKLRILALRFKDTASDDYDDDVTYLFRQHSNLIVLDLNIWFRDERSLKVIADSCPQLRHLSLNINFQFTNFGIHHLLRLMHLRLLQLNGATNGITDAQLEQLVALPQLRALICECCPNLMPITAAAFRTKAQADPGHLYFILLRYTQINEGGNLFRTDTLARGFFIRWHAEQETPFGHNDYGQWERLTRQKLVGAYGPGLQQ